MTLQSKPTVLVADDDDDIRELVCIILRVFGLDPHPVSRGDDALSAARITNPDLAVLDVNMPGLSGLDVCRSIRRDAAGSRVPILLMSAASADADIACGLDAGADEYLVKPFAPKQLMQLVERLIGVTQQLDGGIHA